MYCRDQNYSGSRKMFPGIEIPATWYRTPKWEFQKSAGGGAGTGAGKNGGAGQSAGTGAGKLLCLCFPKGPDLPAPVPALRPAPPFLPAPVPAPPPALFWNSHFGVLYQVAGISIQELISEKLLILLRDRPCLEVIVVSSNFQALLFLPDKLPESV